MDWDVDKVEKLVWLSWISSQLKCTSLFHLVDGGVHKQAQLKQRAIRHTSQLCFCPLTRRLDERMEGKESSHKMCRQMEAGWQISVFIEAFMELKDANGNSLSA